MFGTASTMTGDFSEAGVVDTLATSKRLASPRLFGGSNRMRLLVHGLVFSPGTATNMTATVPIPITSGEGRRYSNEVFTDRLTRTSFHFLGKDVSGFPKSTVRRAKVALSRHTDASAWHEMNSSAPWLSLLRLSPATAVPLFEKNINHSILVLLGAGASLFFFFSFLFFFRINGQTASGTKIGTCCVGWIRRSSTCTCCISWPQSIGRCKLRS